MSQEVFKENSVTVYKHDDVGGIFHQTYKNIYKIYILKGGAVMLVSQGNTRLFLSAKHVLDFIAGSAVEIDMTGVG